MDNIQKAAVLLLGIGEDNAASVLKFMEPKQVQKVGMAMTTMANVSQSDIESVVELFLTQAEKQTSLGANSEDYLRKMEENFVIIDRRKREKSVEELVVAAAGGSSGIPIDDPELLTTVSNMVEFGCR